jgi:uncharacterized protein
VIVPDVNLLIYAVNQNAPHHERARSWLESALSGSEPVGLPWLVLVAFLRLTTNKRIFESPLKATHALDLVTGWLSQPCALALNPGERHWLILSRLLHRAGTAGNLTNDAHLAAIAIEHNACLYSADNDFRRFADLNFENPLDDSRLQEESAQY